jgi:hypothetical protein
MDANCGAKREDIFARDKIFRLFPVREQAEALLYVP